MNIAATVSNAVPLPALNTYGLTRDDIIRHLRAAPETVDGWLAGTRRRPPYFDAALRAARSGLHPIAKPLVARYAKELGIEQQLMNYWLTTGQVPVPARMAVAWIIHRKVTGRD